MWQRFTERARKVVYYAQEEAQALGEGYVSTEHLLLGLIREENSVACRILERLGITRSRVRTEVEINLPRGDARPSQDMTLTPRARRVIDLAYAEARSFNHNYIGTQHLLLGLIREGDGLAGRVLAKVGAGIERAREAAIALEDLPAEPDSGYVPLEAQASTQGVASILHQQPFSASSEAQEVGYSWRFTAATMTILESAWEECRRLCQGYMSPVTLLLSLVRGENSASYLVQSLGVEPDDIVALIEGQLVPGQSPNTLEPYLSPRTKQVLVASWREACRWDSEEVEPEHLLIGILISDGPASKLLADSGIEIEGVRAAFKKAIASGEN